MDVLSGILAWVTPTSLGAAIGWLVNSGLRRTRAMKESHDAFRQMYNDVSEELIKIRNENEKLNKNLEKLSGIISLAHGCSFWDVCPIKHQLHKHEASDGEKCQDGARDGISAHDAD